MCYNGDSVSKTKKERKKGKEKKKAQNKKLSLEEHKNVKPSSGPRTDKNDVNKKVFILLHKPETTQLWTNQIGDPSNLELH